MARWKSWPRAGSRAWRTSRLRLPGLPATGPPPGAGAVVQAAVAEVVEPVRLQRPALRGGSHRLDGAGVRRAVDRVEVIRVELESQLVLAPLPLRRGRPGAAALTRPR